MGFRDFVDRVVFGNPERKRRFWRRAYDYLASKNRSADWTFMNYGYAAEVPEPLTLEPKDEANEASIRLYRHVIGKHPLEGKDVLEASSGRGGGSEHVARMLRPRRMVGLDFSPNAVELCNRIHRQPNLEYVCGDAENLPFEAETFDLVLNVEASHCYGSRPAFFREAFRVLKPGGWLLWADLIHPELIDETDRMFAEAGFEIAESEEITADVVRSLATAKEGYRESLAKPLPRFLRKYFMLFAATPGTEVFENLKNGSMRYLRRALQKR